ncbi:DUF6481 family protein [Rhodobacter capsulatus]|jgi:hypothetical protein|uniref:Uncharacterized protein n=1 Tax=Rhodobacter capsulatus (strain ATCC BAA-309 / NBRC 16581 / SB1003) TaxID=272942 RepID=D5APQ0_RHOCB|nr:DUF6481 family protein [Rhodobacter capsulatus]ADE86619.1 conserved hypothetical protein [Rhodobacter capsulatus SB 1003]ETD00604.1 hypothetical protein U714_15870 [Rhodobacter capsulatus DE442]ETD76317.1 hypothetical protein U716_17720 [Rhodobacter capsulatus B6]ETD78377.1 hypothetical protein U717_06660 [Rhodobacter capsulatus R121]ETD88695.1 hypothetical protein U713_11480 [Rhodobacter capsulatus YW2]
MLKTKDYSDRRHDAISAKVALLEKFKSATSAPDLVLKRAARAEVARLRDARQAAREAEKRKAQESAAAEAAAVAEAEAQRKAAEVAALEAGKQAQARRIALVLSDDAARKAARDLRYAKRKAAQRVA